MERVSIIIPAYQEENNIATTLSTLVKHASWFSEMIVIDDGSSDQTFKVASKWTSKVYRFPQNKGKSAAVQFGIKKAAHELVVMLDADLGESACHAQQLIHPLWDNVADMTIAVLPAAGKKGGWGLVRSFASGAIRLKTGHHIRAPLSGQRALRKCMFEALYKGDRGFGLETGLTLDMLQGEARVLEIEVPFQHRQLGKTYSGFKHRFIQGLAVAHAIYSRR